MTPKHEGVHGALVHDEVEAAGLRELRAHIAHVGHQPFELRVRRAVPLLHLSDDHLGDVDRGDVAGVAAVDEVGRERGVAAAHHQHARRW